MIERTLNRIAASIMAAVLLFFYISPIVGYAAGTFITPGKAITPGKTYFQGEPIQTGQFIIPGEVYQPGKSYEPGKTNGVSGQPLLPTAPFNNGTFLIPNALPLPPGSLYWQLKGMDAGSPLQAGDPTGNGATSSANGNGLDGGKAIDAGDGPNGGQSAEGGKGPDGGQVAEGGKGPDGGKSTEGGKGPDGGQLTEGGKGPDRAKSEGGGDADDPPTTLEVLVKTTDDERGWYSHVTGFFEDFKTYGLGFLNRDVAGTALSLFAGFKIEKIEGTNGYKVSGKKEFKNKLLDNLYQRFKGYEVDGNGRSLGTHTKRIKEKTFNAFLNSKQLIPKNMDLRSYIWNSVKSGVVDGWGPLTKKAFNWNNWKNGSALNKSFFSGSSLMKMNGPLNYIMATAGPMWDYSSLGKDTKKRDLGWTSPDFAAELTTEVAIGVGSTAIGSVASSIAAGAVAGSVVPGLGTVVGAAGGLIAGLGVNYLINGTTRGRKIKEGVTKGLTSLYRGISNGVKGGFRKVSGLFG